MTEKNNKLELEKEFSLKTDFPVPSLEEWKTAVEAELKGADFQKKMFTKTYEEILLKPIYTKDDLQNLSFFESYPSFGNSIRGNKASGYVKNSWLICQQVNSSEPKLINEIIKNDLQKGANSIFLKFDVDEKLLESLDEIFDEINLERFPITLHAGLSNAQLAEAFLKFINEKNISTPRLNVGIISDPLSKFMEDGFIPNDTQKIYKEISDTIKQLKKFFGEIKTIGINGLTFHNAGASAVQKLSMLLSAVVEYANNFQNHELDLQTIFSSMHVSVGIDSNYFMEIAKLRALRILWANLLKSYNLDAEKIPVFIHAETSETSQTLCDPHVNLLRTTTEAFSAIAGGVDSLQIHPFDSLYENVNEFSRRIARNQHIILKDEAHLDKVIDPAGGSYFVENLTNEIANSAWKEFQEIQSKGGLIEALKSNFIQGKIEKVVKAKTKDVRTRKKILVGTNMYSNPKEENVSTKITSIKKQERKINLSGNGKGLEIIPLNKFRPAFLYEELRAKSESYFIENGFKPKVFLFNMGSLKQFKARADFSRSFFELGGFEVIYNNGFNSIEEAVNSFQDSKAKIAVVCSTDETYPEIVPQVMNKIDRQNRVTVLAGYPKEQVELYKAAGIQEFIYLGCDAYETLNRIFQLIEKN